MKKLLFITGAVLGLSGCGLLEQTVNVVMTPQKVTLPESVGSTADLKVGIQVVLGCVTFNKVTVLERTASALKLQVDGLKKKPCPPLPSAAAFDTTFTDAGSPARTNPFEVFVNGKSAGQVTIK